METMTHLQYLLEGLEIPNPQWWVTQPPEALRQLGKTIAAQAKQSFQHGIDCEKMAHCGQGYLHAVDDDSPYDIDGCMYCGRCHRAL